MKYRAKKNKNTRILKVYIFILLYSSLLRLLFGKWSTIVADVFLTLLLLNVVFKRGNLFVIGNKFKIIAMAILLMFIIALLEIFNINITNIVYSLVELRKSYLQILAIFIGYFYIEHSKNEFNSVISFIEFCSIPIILYGIKQYYYFSSLDAKIYSLTDADFYTYYYDGHMRSISIFSGPFHYGMFCSLILVISIYLFLIDKKKIHLIASTLCLFGCYSSITRTNLISSISVLILAILVFITTNNTRKSMYKKVFFMFFGIALFVFWNVIGSEINLKTEMLSTMLNSLNNVTGDSRFMGRMDTWINGIELVANNPIIGNGVGAAGDTLGQFNIAVNATTSHNMILKVFIETGFLGGVILIYIMGKFAGMIFKSNEYEKKFLFSGLSFCVYINGMVGSTISAFPVMTIFWLVMGMGYYQYERETIKCIPKVSSDSSGKISRKYKLINNI